MEPADPMQSLANSGDYFDAEFENIMGVSAEGGVETASSLALSPIALRTLKTWKAAATAE